MRGGEFHPQLARPPVPAGGVTIGKRVPMEYLCYRLVQILRNDDRPVIDKTGLTGFYDFTLTFLPDLPPGFDKANQRCNDAIP
jgi:uncharacterized protein (TIGR03435 family)